MSLCLSPPHLHRISPISSHSSRSHATSPPKPLIYPLTLTPLYLHILSAFLYTKTSNLTFRDSNFEKKTSPPPDSAHVAALRPEGRDGVADPQLLAAGDRAGAARHR